MAMFVKDELLSSGNDAKVNLQVMQELRDQRHGVYKKSSDVKSVLE